MDPSNNRVRRHFTYPNVMSTLAVFLVLAGGTALAAALPNDSVKSKTVKDNSLKSKDLKNDKAVTGDDVVDESLTGDDVADNSLTGTNIAEPTLGQVPDAAQLQGKAPSSFVSSTIYKKESAVGAGTTLGDGTQYIDVACDPGDVLLSGGPANINAATDLLESFPSPGLNTSWRARVNKNALADTFSVVILCADQ